MIKFNIRWVIAATLVLLCNNSYAEQQLASINYRAQLTIPDQPRAFDYDILYDFSGPTRPLIIYIHGGGWENGDKGNTASSIGETFFQNGFAFASVNYRLWRSSQTSCQACTILKATEDIATAFKSLKNRSMIYNLNFSKVILMGHSAGGHLATLFTLNSHLHERLNIDVSNIVGVVTLDTPVFDYTEFVLETNRSSFSDPFTDPRTIQEGARGFQPDIDPYSCVDQSFQSIHIPKFYSLHAETNRGQAIFLRNAILQQNAMAITENFTHYEHSLFINALRYDENGHSDDILDLKDKVLNFVKSL